jgi:hypothetical protein
VDASDDPKVFTPENLRQYKAIVFSNSNNEGFDTDAQREAFKKYGFMHEAGGANDAAKMFRRFLKHAPHANELGVFDGSPLARDAKVAQEQRRELISKVAVAVAAPGPIHFHIW